MAFTGEGGGSGRSIGGGAAGWIGSLGASAISTPHQITVVAKVKKHTIPHSAATTIGASESSPQAMPITQQQHSGITNAIRA